MNLAIRGIDGDLGKHDADTFANDLHKRLRADYILANPPFNVSDYALIPDDARWQYGVPPKNNANYAWIEHIISKLSPKGVAGFVLANGSMSTSTNAEAAIRKNIIEAGLVDCIVTMPPNLFYNVTIPVCLWFLSKNRQNRKDKILFIDARKMGTMVTRKHRELSDEEIQRICDTYHNWRDGKQDYEDIQGFCKSAEMDQIREHEYILTPGRYVGIEAEEEDDEPFDDKMTRLTGELAEMFVKSHELEEEIKKRLGGIGYEI
jgi:type I restriction enzyme M protein